MKHPWELRDTWVMLRPGHWGQVAEQMDSWDRKLIRSREIGPAETGLVMKVRRFQRETPEVDVLWKDGGRGRYPQTSLRRATKAEVAANPGGLALDKRQLKKEIAAAEKVAARAKILDLRGAIDTARIRLAGAAEPCRGARADARRAYARARTLRGTLDDARARVQAARDAWRAARESARAVRLDARAECSTVTEKRVQRRAELAERRHELVAERAWRRQMRILAQHARSAERDRRRRSSGETRSESDDAVRANIPPELVPTFEREKGKIRGSERRSRTEAFLEWVEAHPRELHEGGLDAGELYMMEHERAAG